MGISTIGGRSLSEDLTFYRNTEVTVVIRLFYARSQCCEKRQLATSCLSVLPNGETRIPLDGFS